MTVRRSWRLPRVGVLGGVLALGVLLAGPLHGQPPGDAANGDYGGFYTWPELRARLDALKREHPTLLHETSLGKTLEGREIPLFRLSDDAVPPKSDGTGEAEILLLSGIHPREQVPQTAILRLLEEVLAGYGKDARLTRLVKERQTWIVPVFNMDGKVYDMQHGNGTTRGADWRKNRRKNGDGTFGVDLNRNWPVRWGGNRKLNTAWNTTTDTPKGNIYEGPAALSEPENQALVRFIDSRPLRCFVDIHSPFKEFIVPAYLTRKHAERYQAALDGMRKLQKEPYEASKLLVEKESPAGERGGDTGVTYTWSFYTRGVMSFNLETGSGPGKGRERYPKPELVEEEYRQNLREPFLYLMEACAEYPRPGKGNVRVGEVAVEGEPRPGAAVTFKPTLAGEWEYAVLLSEDPSVVVQSEYRMAPLKSGFGLQVQAGAKPGAEVPLTLYVWDAQHRRSVVPLKVRIAPS